MRQIIFPWPQWYYDFIMQVWRSQGITNPSNCKGTASFSFYPERILYDATDDSLRS